MVCPIAFWRGRGCYLLNTLAQPKHDAGPHPLGPLGCCFLTQLFFQASLEPLGVGSLVFGCCWVQEYGGKSPQFPVNGSSRSRSLAYWHVPGPVIESTNTACTMVPSGCGWNWRGAPPASRGYLVRRRGQLADRVARLWAFNRSPSDLEHVPMLSDHPTASSPGLSRRSRSKARCLHYRDGRDEPGHEDSS